MIPILHADQCSLRDERDKIVAVFATGDYALDCALASEVARTLNTAPRVRPGALASIERARAALADLEETLRDELGGAYAEIERLRAALSSVDDGR